MLVGSGAIDQIRVDKQTESNRCRCLQRRADRQSKMEGFTSVRTPRFIVMVRRVSRRGTLRTVLEDVPSKIYYILRQCTFKFSRVPAFPA
eukprot:scaffold152_cov163-Amphora_coffeaeformis.AAC.3